MVRSDSTLAALHDTFQTVVGGTDFRTQVSKKDRRETLHRCSPGIKADLSPVEAAAASPPVCLGLPQVGREISAQRLANRLRNPRMTRPHAGSS